MFAQTDSKNQNEKGNESIVPPKGGIAECLMFSIFGLFGLCLLGSLLFLWRPALPIPVASLIGATATPSTRYPFAIWSAEYSPDGKRIVTAGNDKTVRVWDAGTGKQLMALSAFEEVGGHACYGHDGTKIISRDAKAARVWDAETGKELLTLRQDLIDNVAFSPDGRQVLTEGGDTTTIWDATTGKEQTVLKDAESFRFWSAAYSPDGKQVVTAESGAKDTARIWDAATGATLFVLEGHSDTVWDAVYSSDGKRIVTASKDKTARIWDAATGNPLSVLSGHTDNVWDATFSPDGEQVATASEDGTTRIWDAATGKELLVLRGQDSGGWSAVYSPDGKQIATFTHEGPALVWDAKTGKELAVLGANDSKVASVVFSSDGSRILTGHQEGTAQVWDTASWNQVLVLDPHGVMPEKAAAGSQSKTSPTATALPSQAEATTRAAQSLLQTTSQWPVILSDTFDAVGHGWTTDTYDTGIFQVAQSISGGKYRWALKAKSSNALTLDLPMNLPGHRTGTGPMSEYAVSVEGWQVSGTPNGRYGLVFRYDWGSSNYYVFDVADDQSFKFGKGIGEFPREPLLTGKSAAIKPGEVNRLIVVASVNRFLFLPTGNRYTFFVNDKYVAQVEDNTIKYGDTGPAVELAKAGDAAAFEFDNFEVRAP